MKNWKMWSAYAMVCILGVFCIAGQSDRLLSGQLQSKGQESTSELHSQKSGFAILDETVGPTQDSAKDEVRMFSSLGPGTVVSIKDGNLLGGARLTMLSNQSASQMMSFVIETSRNNLIVVDGGTPEDAGHLADTIRAKGGRVSAWLITHPHSDHVGALNTILNQADSQITIDNIYYSFADLNWYYANEEYRADMVAQLLQTFSRVAPDKLHSNLGKGFKFNVDDISIEVLNSPYLFEHNSINNSSIGFRLKVNGKSIVFLGDMGEEAGNMLLQEYQPGALKCDILQMTHHGQYGVSEQVYQALSPEICLWPTPDWLWNNDNGGGMGSGPWFTLETRAWMEKMGIVKHYCIKDGDQVIE